MIRPSIVGAFLLAIVGAAGAQSVATRVTSPADRELITALVAIEDARDTVVMGNDVRRRGLASTNPFVRAFAVRGLGRLERVGVLDVIAPSLADSSAEVRSAAADAVAQAVARGRDSIARGLLLSRLAVERDPVAKAMLLESIGRLPQGSDRVRATATTIGTALSDSSPVVRHGAIRGLFFLARRREARTAGVVPAEYTDRLYELLTRPEGAGASSEDRMAMASILSATLTLSGDRVPTLAADKDAAVRERAVVEWQKAPTLEAAQHVLYAALEDPSPLVRYRAGAASAASTADYCRLLPARVRDRDMTVALAAVDGLGACGGNRNRNAVRLADSLSQGDVVGDRWHMAAHATVALAFVDRSWARFQRLPRMAASPNFFVRMYADSVARLVSDTATLYRLARDPVPNVRTSAVKALSDLVGHAADSVYRSALASNDNQLLMAAAAALAGGGPDNGETRSAAISALSRLRSEDKETSTDGVNAIVRLLRGIGARVDDQLQIDAAKSRKAPTPTPTFEELAQFERLTATIEMADGSVIDFKLHPFDAPTNVARFVRLARAGTFDGLTFHRIAPFFVVQGPSPNANEYSAPDGPFTRDELGLSNLRGTVGLSTRGRDTGDGQFYINTVDNIRLDHDYTVMGTIVKGLEAFDRMQEGAKIRRIFVR